jgi:DNA-binding NtrC family response regulator
MTNQDYRVAVVSADAREIENLHLMLSEDRRMSAVYRRLEELMDGLGRDDRLAAIIDIDTVRLTNRNVRNLAGRFPEVSIFCISTARLHPHLQDAMTRHIRACLVKPVDPDELRFWLRSMHDTRASPDAL